MNNNKMAMMMTKGVNCIPPARRIALLIPCFPNPCPVSAFPDPYCRICLGNIALLYNFAYVIIVALYRLDVRLLPIVTLDTSVMLP